MHVLRQATLDALDLLGVEAELQHVLGPCRTRELGVDRLVGAILAALEEVGESLPVAIRKIRLIQVVVLAGRDRCFGETAGAFGVEGLIPLLVVVGGKPEHTPSVPLEAREISFLVLDSLATENLAVLIGENRPLLLAPRHRQLEPRVMAALEKSGEVGRRENEPAVGLLHGRKLSLSGGSAWRERAQEAWQRIPRPKAPAQDPQR